jgi:hypothetical protein
VLFRSGGGDGKLTQEEVDAIFRKANKKDETK